MVSKQKEVCRGIDARFKNAAMVLFIIKVLRASEQHEGDQPHISRSSVISRCGVRALTQNIATYFNRRAKG